MKKKTPKQKAADGLIKDLARVIDDLTMTGTDDRLKATLVKALEKLRKHGSEPKQ